MECLFLLARFLMCLGAFCLTLALTKLTILLCRLVKDDLIKSVEAEEYDFCSDNNN